MNFLEIEERKLLLSCMHKKQDVRLYKRMHAVILFDDGLSVRQISSLFYLDEETIRSYIDSYKNDGIPEANIFKYKGKQSKLTREQLDELKNHLTLNIYPAASAIKEYVESKYSILYTSKGITKLLKKMKFVYKKPIAIPGKADSKKQEEFLKEVLTPLVETASDASPLYFHDASHPTHNVQPCYGWILKGSEAVIKTNTGRERININGAVCFHSMDVISREDDTINADSTLELLKVLRLRHKDEIVISIIMDNAKYNRANKVTQYAKENKINLVYLPPYAPNLNLIERLWKYMKEKVCSKYHERFKDFKNAISGFLRDLFNEKEKLKTLMSPKFKIRKA